MSDPIPFPRRREHRSAESIVRDPTLPLLERLHASKIEAAVSTFFARGFLVQLGDEDGGIKDARRDVPSWEEVEAWLRSAAVNAFPSSLFAAVELHGPHAEWQPREGADFSLARGQLDQRTGEPAF